MILTFVSVCDFIGSRLLPDTFAFFHAFDEDTRVGIAIGPPILTVTIGLSIVVLSQIDVSIGKGI